MIITLTQSRRDQDWIGDFKGEKVLLCPSGMQLLRVSGNMVNLELSLFVQKGMIQVDLVRNGIWRWSMPKRPSMMIKMSYAVGSFCFGFDESVVDAILTEMGMQKVSKLVACSIWVKFTSIPPCQTYAVRVYNEVCTEVSVFMPVNATPQSIAAEARKLAHKVPSALWEDVPDSITCDPSSDIQVSLPWRDPSRR